MIYMIYTIYLIWLIYLTYLIYLIYLTCGIFGGAHTGLKHVLGLKKAINS